MLWWTLLNIKVCVHLWLFSKNKFTGGKSYSQNVWIDLRLQKVFSQYTLLQSRQGSPFQRWLLDEATLGVPLRVSLPLLDLTCTPRSCPREAVCRRLSLPLRAAFIHLYSWASWSMWRSGDVRGVMQPAVTQPKPLQCLNLAQITRLRALASLRPIIPK